MIYLNMSTEELLKLAEDSDNPLVQALAEELCNMVDEVDEIKKVLCDKCFEKLDDELPMIKF